MPKRLTDDETRAIVAARLSRTLDSTDSELRSDRENALNFYYGRPLGNEIDGRAQVVTKDVMDTIEWMMPSLIRALDNPKTVQFDPIGPEDEKQATHESLYIRHVIWKKNPGWMLMYNWLKDALMQKVGYAHYWWEDGKKHSFDHYENLTDEQLILLGQEMKANGIEATVMGASQGDDGTWSIKLRKTKSYACAKWCVYPPDEVIVDKDCDGDIKQARSVFHQRKHVTRSELVEMGFSKKRVAELTSYDWRADSEESRARDTVNETSFGETEEEDSDPASKELEILRCWTYLDKDGDGIAELRYLMLAGNDTLIDEECPEIPWCSITPTPVPHRHMGLSVYDMIEDLQRINTALNRGLLDNTYFTQNPRIVFDQNTVNPKMLGVNRPGGHVANNGPVNSSMMPIPVIPMAGNLLPVIQHFAEMRENRVGVGKMTAGLDADALGRATKGAYLNAQTTSSQRIEMIAAVFANTGIADLFSSMHRLSMRHQDRATHEKLDGKWVPINPMEWMDRANMTISVGATSKDEIRANLTAMASAQQQAAQIPGLIQPKNVAALFRDMQEVLGLSGKPYITDPESPEYEKWQKDQSEKAQNAPPDPYLQAEQMKAQQRAQESQNNAQLKALELGTKKGLDIAKLELQYNRDLAAPGIGAELGNRGGGGAAGAPRAAAPQ